MCGIVGWMNYEENLSYQTKVIDLMNKQHANRGPDSEGTWIGEHVALGHRRLSVMDPENGLQPMVKQFGNQQMVVTYNGELYNMVDLRMELESLGYCFTTHCDTELLPAAYQEWGVDAPKRMNGIFAFAIWDEFAQELYIARDRIGVKPLFYAHVKDTFVFGSEIKSLLQHPDIGSVIDDHGLAEVLMMGPARTPGEGVFRDIKELKPGHWLKVSRQGIQTHPYWQLVSRAHEDDFETTITKVTDLFEASVRRQLISDVPIGTMLSGGLDSSAISAVAAKVFREEGKGRLTTFSIDYQDNDQFFEQNEFQPNADSPWAQLMAEFLQSDHHVVYLNNQELVDHIPSALIARDFPGMADIDSSLMLFSREIKKDLTVCLSGECADEVFGGYPWFHREEMVQANIFPWACLTNERIPFIRKDVQDRIQPMEYVEMRYQQTLEEVPRCDQDSPREDRMKELFYMNLTRWMPTLLDRKDRMSMAYGLEVRVPFCDHHLVEYVWNIPWEMKAHNGREKGLLRHALKGILPDEIIERKKSPYPKTHHPLYLQAMQRKVNELLLDKQAPIWDFLDYQVVQRFVGQDLKQKHLPWFGQLMNVPALLAYWLQFNQWLVHFQVQYR
ncbi:asparagine synthase (glutamine-hydrolysing) [Thermoactinomyces sp. DSM 45891]|uniref:asparagine synthase (glutamine-hydrolyzing) n=1 Tax=Thermoactinomyces sp. DSM 45891 TaxID=1761907 RepID=UPI0009187F2B|nr:asparagine synthase (glutamine-hydrolyzing) [Thermoactinomyces sp. DSM 45891]SFX31668.1 asparagine synthase (glutamine-hydrolysing) [Thermoactinomyces sp. DSM 45891]